VSFKFVQGGLNAKTLFIYSVSYFCLRGLELCLGGLSTPKAPRGNGTVFSKCKHPMKSGTANGNIESASEKFHQH